MFCVTCTPPNLKLGAGGMVGWLDANNPQARLPYGRTCHAQHMQLYMCHQSSSSKGVHVPYAVVHSYRCTCTLATTSVDTRIDGARRTAHARYARLMDTHDELTYCS
jgi:hypothetical protein